MTPPKPLVRRFRDFLAFRARPLRGLLLHRLLRPLLGGPSLPQPLRLHVGCGARRLDGWLNLDLQPLPEVDLAHDVTRGLPFENVEAVYAEHFLEHLDAPAAVKFLLDAHAALSPGGALRLSTPNLDWVLAAHSSRGLAEPEQVRLGLGANRSFYGWGHRFLWNRALLERALLAAGFADLSWCAYGESNDTRFETLEQHETCPDTPDLPHVLVVEGRKGEARPGELAELRALLEEEVGRYLE
jgi:hypothetical protein